MAVMEAVLEECKPLALRRFRPIINAGENTWHGFYQIRDSNKAAGATGKGFDTDKTAMAAGRKKARELKA